jgi:hypothetical protein
MATCCCYQEIGGPDYGCATVAGSTCPAIPGYELVSSTPGECLTADAKACAELQELVEKAESDSKN